MNTAIILRSQSRERVGVRVGEGVLRPAGMHRCHLGRRGLPRSLWVGGAPALPFPPLPSPGPRPLNWLLGICSQTLSAGRPRTLQNPGQASGSTT